MDETKTADTRSGSSMDREVYAIRRAQKRDARLLWEWANEPTTRKQSFNPNTIPWPDHQTWLARILSSGDARLWIIESEGIPVGQIRYERSNPEVAYISFSVAKCFRGRGIGTQLLRLTALPAARELRVGRLRGVTFADNRASQRAFLNAGFTICERPMIRGHQCIVFERSCESGWMETGAVS